MPALADPMLVAAGTCAWLAAAVWTWRFVRTAGAYLRYPRMPTRQALADAPPVSIIVPARNEETNIGPCLESLLAQNYPRLEVIAIDDNSRDRTREIIAGLARRDGRLQAASALPTPPGWTGKNWALHSVASLAKGDWLLFTDADTRHNPYALASSMSYAIERRLDVLSLVPRALTPTLWERLLQPAPMGYIGRWFPLERVNDPRDPLAFANGQFLMLRREAYERLGGHEAVREAFLEDVAFARGAKRAGLRAECVLAKRQVGVRMYDTVPRFFRGWHRIFLHAFDRRAGTLCLKALDLAFFSVLPFVVLAYLVFRRCYPGSRAALALADAVSSGAAQGDDWLWFWRLSMAGALVAVMLIYAFAARVHSSMGQKRFYALFHPLAAGALVAVFLRATGSALQGTPTRWR